MNWKQLVEEAAEKADETKRDMNDLWVHRVVNENKVSCVRGCNWCCYQMAMVSLFEGVVIAKRLLEQNRKDDTMKLISQGSNQMEMLLEAGYPSDAVGPMQAVDEWFARQVPCALLKNGECSVYRNRPTCCLTYFVISPPECCEIAATGGKDNTVGSVDYEGPLKATLMVDALFLNRVLGDAAMGVMPAQYPLGYAVSLGVVLLTQGPEGLKRHMGTAEEEEVQHAQG